jgi:Protein of unknown function (DUF2924)
MKDAPQAVSTSEVIRSLPKLPRAELLALWQKNFGTAATSLRREMLIPVLAFRIQEKAYGGLSTDAAQQIREIADAQAKKSRTNARQRFKAGTRLLYLATRGLLNGSVWLITAGCCARDESSDFFRL